MIGRIQKREVGVGKPSEQKSEKRGRR